MSKLLYIPNGTICTFHVEASPDRTPIIELSQLYTSCSHTIESCINVLCKALILGTAEHFREVNNLPKTILIEEFEVIDE